MRRAAVAALAVALVTAGCSRSAAPPAERVLRIVTGTDLPTLNELVTDNAQLQLYATLFNGYLLRTDANGSLIPDLAVGVPTVTNGGVADGGRTIRYRLRSDVRWHDGTPFDARDVVFSFAAARNPRNNVPDRSGFDDIISVQARGRYEVDVRLRRVYSPAVVTFFTLGANDAYPILPAHLLASARNLNQAPYNAAPVGLGPYRFVSWQRGSKLVLEADPHYFRGAPKIRRIEIAIVPDQNTQLAVWRSGGADLLFVAGFGATKAALDQATSAPGARLHLRDHYQFAYIMFNLARAPLRELPVRRAIVQGIDREMIMRNLQGRFYRAGSSDRLPGQFAYDPALRQPAFDRTSANAILEAAGWRLRDGYRERNGVPLSVEIVSVAGSSLSERFTIQLQEQLRRLGIRASVKPYQYSMLFLPYSQGGILANGRFDMAFYGWQPNEDQDHSYLFRCDTRPPSGENYGRICDPVIDRAAQTELRSMDPATQERADREITRRVVEASDVLFLGFDREALLTRNGLTGVKPAVTGQHFWNAWEWRFASTDR